MNELEIKMLIVLNNTLDSIRKARELGHEEAADNWVYVYNAQQSMVREVTGKEVVAKDYRAYFKEI